MFLCHLLTCCLFGAPVSRSRVILLILMMLIIIPLLTVTDDDVSLQLGVQFVHQLGMLHANDPTTYEVGTRQFCLDTAQSH